VGVVGVADLSVTVAVHVEASFTTTGDVQMTVVVVEWACRILTAMVNVLGPLPVWVPSPG
jgi:hypothetical protein